MSLKLNILQSKNPLLRKLCKDVQRKELIKKETQELIEYMLGFMKGTSSRVENTKVGRHKTVGLSAIQLGILKSITVVDFSMGKGAYRDICVLINPKIIWHSKVQIDRREGCLNLPDIWGVVPRYKVVKVKTLSRMGDEMIIRTHGWRACLLQHEIDHLNGILFIDRLKDPSRAHFVKEGEVKRYRKEFKAWKNYINVSDIVKPL